MLLRVIMAIDKPALQARLKRSLTRSDVIAKVLRGEKDLWQRISRESADLFVVSHSRIPEPVPDAISVLRKLPESPMVVVLSDQTNPVTESRLLAAGCEAMLSSALSAREIEGVLEAVLDKRREAEKQGVFVRRPLAQPRLEDFVSASPAMRAFMSVARRVVASDVSLLIQGETGVGKERLARAIHAEGPRSEGPFIAVNCGAIPESLLESELFGHEEGAFTGASRARRGWFELAHRGTIFLDEIGETPYHLQVKLLRVLQEHEIQRVGSEASVPINVRVMAATNRDLQQLVEDKRFRRDLFYRLSVVTLTVPPLRERREDIPELVDSYINHLRHNIGASVDSISPEALEALSRYSWPGNVRELINVLERAMLLCNGTTIGLIDVPRAISGMDGRPQESVAWAPNSDPDPMPEAWLQKPWKDVRRSVVASWERAYLASLLRDTGGRVGETARRAGMRPRSLYEKMQRYGLRKEEFRAAGPERQVGERTPVDP